MSGAGTAGRASGGDPARAPRTRRAFRGARRRTRLHARPRPVGRVARSSSGGRRDLPGIAPAAQPDAREPAYDPVHRSGHRSTSLPERGVLRHLLRCDHRDHLAHGRLRARALRPRVRAGAAALVPRVELPARRRAAHPAVPAVRSARPLRHPGRRHLESPRRGQPARPDPGADRVRAPAAAPHHVGRLQRRGAGLAVRVAIDGLTVRFGPVTAVDGLALEIRDRELLALVGPSGCGKTTTLGFVAGFVKTAAGRLSFDDRDVTAVPPERRRIGYVFQDYAIYPHMTVAENIRFPLEVARMARGDMRRAVSDIAELVGVSDLLPRRPHQLSGGQRQRVALARALVQRPGVLLLAEPLSNLDAHLRVQTRAEIRPLQLELGMTTILVTHDQSEALAIADRVAVMWAGRVVALASPGAIYDRPASLLAARFVGSPQMNTWDLADAASEFARVALGGALADVRRSARGVVVGVRPEDVRLDPRGVPGTVALVETLGRDILLHADVAGSSVRALVTPAEASRLRTGAAVAVRGNPQRWPFFHPGTGGRAEPPPPPAPARSA